MSSVDLSNARTDEPVRISSEKATRRVWDLPVRIFHWALVLSFVGAYLSNRAGVEYFTYHLWFGYAVVVLIAFRIVWGLVGTRHARFWSFVPGPVGTLRYLGDIVRRRPTHYSGHNPLGALMVLALLASLLVQSVAGLFANDEIVNTGPLIGFIDEDLSLRLTSLHRQLFYWIAAAVGLHIVGVLVHVIFKREPLIRAMFTGRKPATLVARSEEIASSRLWLAVVLLAGLAGALAWAVKHAPAF